MKKQKEVLFYETPCTSLFLNVGPQNFQGLQRSPIAFHKYNLFGEGPRFWKILGQSITYIFKSITSWFDKYSTRIPLLW